MSPLPANIRVTLLLTAPLGLSREAVGAKLLTPGELARLRRALARHGATLADLVPPAGEALLVALAAGHDTERLRVLLDRDAPLAQALDRWAAQSIWVLDATAEGYPTRYTDRLANRAPVLLYGHGPRGTLAAGGLAVVGSRDADGDSLVYATEVGARAAAAGVVIISGGARGIDQTAMLGALEAGGEAVGVLAEPLERAMLRANYRAHLADGRLTLVSANDPGQRFQPGLARARNRLIYALADAALVVATSHGRGGTWQGAQEALTSLPQVPLYARAGSTSPGLRDLLRAGAQPWPEPTDPTAWANALTPPPAPIQRTLDFDV
mgnify:FL=1